jgi:hypothetical protein
MKKIRFLFISSILMILGLVIVIDSAASVSGPWASSQGGQDKTKFKIMTVDELKFFRRKFALLKVSGPAAPLSNLKRIYPVPPPATGAAGDAYAGKNGVVLTPNQLKDSQTNSELFLSYVEWGWKDAEDLKSGKTFPINLYFYNESSTERDFFMAFFRNFPAGMHTYILTLGFACDEVNFLNLEVGSQLFASNNILWNNETHNLVVAFQCEFKTSGTLMVKGLIDPAKVRTPGTVAQFHHLQLALIE